MMGNTAAYWAEGDRLLLLDCGETVFTRLLQCGVLQGKKHVYAAISHLHSDHCGSLGSLAFYCKFALGIRLVLLTPESESYVRSLTSLLALYGADTRIYSLMPAETDLGLIGISSLQYVPTMHAPGMECFSFVLETPEGGIFYSADTRTEIPLLDFLDTHDCVHRIYMETTLREVPDGVHLPLSRLAAVLPKELRPVTYLMHLPGPDCRAAGEALGLQTVPVE